MSARRMIVATALSAAIAAAPSTAYAKGGKDTRATGPTTPVASTACVNLVAANSGLITRKGSEDLKFTAKSCSSAPQTLQTTVDDHAVRVLYPNMSCGDITYVGPALTLQPNEQVSFSIPTKRGTCTIASSESHDVTLTALDDAGSSLAVAYTHWEEAARTQSR